MVDAEDGEAVAGGDQGLGRQKQQKQSEQQKSTGAEHDEQVVSFREIGVCESVFANKRGVPRQGNLAPDTLGRVVLHKHVGDAALEGLDAFSHVWIVFVFSRNTNKSKVAAWVRGDAQVILPSKIRPPLLQGKSTGMLSTRTPHRPNPIGLTLATVRSVDLSRRHVIVGGIDLCHLTPVLDLKPFVPGDVPLETPRFASWVLAEQNLAWTVEFTTKADQDMDELVQAGVTRFYRTVAELKRAVEQVVRLDVRAVHQGRQGISKEPCSQPTSVSQQCVVDGIQFLFSVADSARLATVLGARAYDEDLEGLAKGNSLKKAEPQRPGKG
ncbi:tRNA adenine37-N6-methyltransferase [Hondaea fermentalgiana]|uniref:tRNA adenine37-N6-methyltransferase n=1 Tax=Hondaea fermentalgiana TaxID=2315210 RepID=A0A2R5GC77_9STRA|nr:tRNA adenine37-N6-methyltransferase [Hondaea fermentalgiana]|eukprot:GBG28580.1 tRNA adenine37-N6-methyltransferase [Hondaea fermentalgiana]